MVQEATGVEPIVETPVESPAVPEPIEPIEAPEVPAEPIVEETEGADPRPQSLEDLVGNDDNLKSAYELHTADTLEKGRRQAQSEIQPRVDKANQTFQNFYQKAHEGAEGMRTIREELKQALESGAVQQRDLENAFKAVPEAWKAINDLTGNAGFFNGQRWAASALGQELGGEAGAKFAGEWGTRWFNAEAGVDDSAEVFKEMSKAFVEAQIDKITTPLRNRVKALEAQIERAKSQTGASGGPSPSAGQGNSGGKGYATLQEAQLAHARDEISNNEMRRLRAAFAEAERNR